MTRPGTEKENDCFQIASGFDAADKLTLYRGLIESAFDGFFLSAYPSGEIIEINRKAGTMLGVDPEQILGESIWDFIAGDESLLIKKRAEAEFRGQITTAPFRTCSIQRKDGTQFRADIAVTVKVLEGCPYLQGVFRDITLQEQMTQHLQRSQKMEAIGTLASGIAHDLNNLLSPIMGNAELAGLSLSNPVKAGGYIDGILKAARRAQELTHQILAFGRPKQTGAPEALKLQPVLSEIVNLIRSTHPQGIEIQEEIDDACGPVLADHVRIHQIVMNLLTNAYHAMADTEGVLKVKLQEIDIVQGDLVSAVSRAPGRYALLCISDSGCGMAEETQKKIFDPYFTTKQSKGGFGLGLFVVQKIVKRIGGDISIYSEEGIGTTFHVYLPIVKDAELGTIAESVGSVPGGTERILVVDDEHAIITILKEMLSNLGYQVTALDNSTKALELFENDPAAFDVIITDMIMPEMVGDVLAAKAVAIRPDIPIILSSGFSGALTRAAEEKIGIRKKLIKPITLSQWATAIREVLDQ